MEKEFFSLPVYIDMNCSFFKGRMHFQPVALEHFLTFTPYTLKRWTNPPIQNMETELFLRWLYRQLATFIDIYLSTLKY